MSSGTIFPRFSMYLPDGELTNKVVFHLPLASADKCEEYRERYDKVFTKSDDFKDMEYVQCVEDLRHRVRGRALAFNRSVKGDNEGRSELIRYSDEDAEELRVVFIRVNPPSLHNLDELLYFYQRLDLSETSPLFRISTCDRTRFSVQHVFVQNEPVITATGVHAGTERQHRRRLSDVTSTWIFYVSEDADPRFASKSDSGRLRMTTKNRPTSYRPALHNGDFRAVGGNRRAESRSKHFQVLWYS